MISIGTDERGNWGGALAVVLALLPMLAACAESQLADIDGGDPVVDAGTEPAVDAGIDVPAPPPRVYPPLNDPSVGADETSLPLCDRPDTTMFGPRGAVCSGYDNPCGRGIREPEGCCRLEPRHAGTGCGDGLMCDGASNCVPRTGAAPRSINGMIGTDSWIDNRPLSEYAGAWPIEPPYEGVRFSFRGEFAMEVIPAAGEQVPLEQIHLVNGRYYGVEAFAIVAPITKRAFYFPAGTTDVCLALGDVDAMPDIRGDCTSADTFRVTCPSSTGAFQCEVFDSFPVRVSGDNIGLAWVPGGALAGVTDMRRALVGPALLGLPASSSTAAPRVMPSALVLPTTCSPRECTAGQTSSCKNACNANGTRTCVGKSGCWSACSPAPVEVCDGIDNDCDGAIDEEGSIICDDGVLCTADSCARSPLPPFAKYCAHDTNPSACTTTVAGCAVPRCNGVGAAWPPNPADTTTTRNAATGCSALLRNDWCTNTWSDCACDGFETCQQASNGADFSGCFTSPAGTGVGGTWMRYQPCETDQKYCTTSVPFCCEPAANRPENGGACRNLTAQSPAARAAYNTACYSPTTSVLRSGARIGPTGELVSCMLEGIGGLVREWPLWFDDTPCTTDVCDEPTTSPWAPTITHTWKPLGTQAPIPDMYRGVALTGLTCGTTPTVNEGCGTLHCVGSSYTNVGIRGCEIIPLVGEYPAPDNTACHAKGAVQVYPGMPSCMTWGCDGSYNCMQITHDELCQDNRACTTSTCVGGTFPYDVPALWGPYDFATQRDGCETTYHDELCAAPPATGQYRDACYNSQCALASPAGVPTGVPGCFWVPDPTPPLECAPIIL
jgi:hypothetical protein